MFPIIEKDNFLSFDDCNILIEYQKSHATNDHSKWSLENHQSNWDNRIFICDNIDDDNVRTIIESIHYRTSILCSKFYNEEYVYPEFSNLVYWGPGMRLGAHADNYWIDDPEKPHYTSHRDYSAVLYLNEDYIGGRTFFLEDNYNVVPKIGKLILFTSGKDHIHGVNEVISGSRYTMALWFTKTRDKLFKISK